MIEINRKIVFFAQNYTKFEEKLRGSKNSTFDV